MAEIRVTFMETTVNDERHAKIERDGRIRVTNPERGVFFILKGGRKVDGGWAHPVVTEVDLKELDNVSNRDEA